MSASADGHRTYPLGKAAQATNERQSRLVTVAISRATTLSIRSAPRSPMQVGSFVTVVLTETNSGDVDLTNVSVSGGGACASFSPANVPTLAKGASQDFTCTFTAAQIGRASCREGGHGADALGKAAPDTNEHQSGQVTVTISPATTLTTKSIPSRHVQSGSTFTLVVTETNSGDVDLTNVSVSGGGACASFSPANVPTLAKGASQDFTCTFTAA